METNRRGRIKQSFPLPLPQHALRLIFMGATPWVRDMIVTRTPFRISFSGGGSDIPAFYEKHGGHVVSSTIDKYVYISSNPSFKGNRTILKYSAVEDVCDLSSIRHRVFRACLQKYGINGLEINSTSDIPAGTGMGSSSTFTVGLLANLHGHRGVAVSERDLAEEACEIEITRLGEPIGKQDQYAAAFGGLNHIEFKKNGSVEVSPIEMDAECKKRLQENLFLVYLGGTRSASKLLKTQTENFKSEHVSENQKKISDLALLLKDRLESGDIDAMGEILDRSWQLKKTLSDGISSERINHVYDTAMKHGATGGKLLGAGGNGFMLFYADHTSKKNIMENLGGLRELPFSFEETGGRIVYRDR